MLKKILLASTLSFVFTNSAFAVTQSVTANIAFDTGISITKNNDADFGTVQALTAETYTLSTAGAVTAAGSGQIIGGTPAAASLTIVGSTTQAIDIAVNNYSAAAGGVTISNATCNYDSGGSGSCALTAAAAPGAGKTLLVGLDAAVDATPIAGASATPTFDVVVTYN